MRGVSNLAELCRLIEDSLRPYTELHVLSVTEEREVLVTLSKILRQVKHWTQELGSDSDEVHGEVAGSDTESDCMYVKKSLTHLVVLLTVESRFIKHLACNVLVVVSQFVAAFGSSHWDAYIRLLCDCIDLAIAAAAGVSDHCSSLSSLVVVLRPKMKIGDWSVAAGVVRVLRDVLRCLKSEDDDEIFEVFVEAVNSFLSAVPWDLLNEVRVSTNAKKRYKEEVIFQRSLFLGNLIQFICSLVEQGGLVESANKHHPVFSTIINVVPKLLCLCLGEQTDNVNFNHCISQYFKHKLLVLMIRLVVQTHPESSILVSWLQHIHFYFQEFLVLPITPLKSSQDDCLEDSPFLSSLADLEVNSLPACHLQRQTVFLFLRCSLALINSKGVANLKCACASWNLCLNYVSTAELHCCGKRKGLLELYNWLQEHLPANTLVDHELYFETCADFARSFLQLYIKEDDVLFKVLLQLLCVPFSAETQGQMEKGSFQNSKGNVVFVVSDLLNPVLLFHLFLLELSYDHQVLLDYLISKDTGISCAEYLLRCLRKVCDSWSLFVNFPLSGQAISRSSCKKRKVSMGGSAFCSEDVFAPVKDPRCSFLGYEHEYDCKHTQGYFKKVKGCLLSLKISIEGLHQKNLFPYNPSALLNRLTRFQELCLEEVK